MVTPTCGHFTVQVDNPGTISYRPCKYKGIMMHSLVTVPCQRKLDEILGNIVKNMKNGQFHPVGLGMCSCHNANTLITI